MNSQNPVKKPVISKREIAKTCAIAILIPFAVIGFEDFARFILQQT